jgi:RES domain-containing protein
MQAHPPGPGLRGHDPSHALRLAIERIADEDLPVGWSALSPGEQVAARLLGDAWVARQRLAALSVPSVILGERNYVLNPAHSDFARIEFAQPETFRFDLRLISREAPLTDKEAHREPV